jgi:hypothetical protein
VEAKRAAEIEERAGLDGRQAVPFPELADIRAAVRLPHPFVAHPRQQAGAAQLGLAARRHRVAERGDEFGRARGLRGVGVDRGGAVTRTTY